jgi:uncharacterized protein
MPLASLITLDSSLVIALLVERDTYHDEAVRAFAQEPGPAIIPAGILSELSYMVEQRLGALALLPFLEDLGQGVVALDCGETDFPRISHLMQRYDDMRLGFADAAVIACAERNGRRVMTFDRRHFEVVAREGAITLVP